MLPGVAILALRVRASDSSDTQVKCTLSETLVPRTLLNWAGPGDARVRGVHARVRQHGSVDGCTVPRQTDRSQPRTGACSSSPSFSASVNQHLIPGFGGVGLGRPNGAAEKRHSTVSKT